MNFFSPANSTLTPRGQLIRSCLLIGVTALLVLWLSGGFPPATWILLLHTLVYMNVIWARQGSAVILPIIILVLQSILSGIAWGLLVWLTMREISYFRTPRRSRLSGALAASLIEAPRQEDQAARIVPLIKEEQASLRRRRATRTNTPKRGREEEAMLKNPFEDDTKDHFEVQKAVLNIFPHEQFPQRQADMTPPEPELLNEPVEPEVGPEPEEEDPFVFGNPFDGPLPDVFSYDIDLKNSVQEMEQEQEKKRQGAPATSNAPAKNNSTSRRTTGSSTSR